MENDRIEIKGASENNLKHIDVSIPKGKLVVLAGVSGSGKSSLAFDTIAVESNRQWQSSYPLYLRNRLPHYERPCVDSICNLTPSIVVTQKSIGANVRSTVGTFTDISPLIRLLFSRIGQPCAGGAMSYSFNHPLGMCTDCKGLGERMVVDEDALFDIDKSIDAGAILFKPFDTGSWQGWFYRNCPLLDAHKPLKEFSTEEWKVLKYGSMTPFKMKYTSNNTGEVIGMDYEGVITRFNRLYLNRNISKLGKNIQREILRFIHKGPCATCGGTGLNHKALDSLIGNHNIADYHAMQVSDLVSVLQQVDAPMGRSIAGQMLESLKHMVDVGLGYLSLSRRTETLSGGEAQRLKMVRHLGSGLSNLTYIFDEPTSGLHPDDAERIGRLLVGLRNKHNTVLVVEHSRQMMEIADEIIELGLAAGKEGGEVIFQGTPKELKNSDTATARYLREKVLLNDAPRKWTDSFPLKHVNRHNLQDVSTEIPRGVLTSITGVAGSGKSSLCEEFIFRYPEAIVVSQKPIGASSRSTAATYIGVMDDIRKCFAIANDVGAEWFSFNSKGACLVCGGKGEITPDVAFADPITILCEECQGHRYNKTALGYTYKGLNIEQVLRLTAVEALELFREKKIHTRLQLLKEVGLDYISLGQTTSTMSGGEIQRLKLVSELHKHGNIYLLDEPANGLHGKNIQMLISLLNRLVNQGNTVVIVEHHAELIANADYIIDMGPEGGNRGGQIVFTGSVSELILCEHSKTGAYLKATLS